MLSKRLGLLLLWLIGAVLPAIVGVLYGTQPTLLVVGMLVSGCMLLIAVTYFRLSDRLSSLADLTLAESITQTNQLKSLLYIQSAVRLESPLPPLRNMAISPDFAATLVSVILKEKPRTIVELGSGVSTILGASCLEQLGAGRLISVDHEQEYADKTRKNLEERGLSSRVQVIHAPMTPVTVASAQWSWYDSSFVTSLSSVDLLIVDGPPAWIQPLARYPALPLLIKSLSPSATILLDDAGRPDELEMIARWLKEFPGLSRFDLQHEKGTTLLRRSAPA